MKLGRYVNGSFSCSIGVIVLHVFRVTCRVLTESSVSLRVGNGPSISNPFPATAVAKLPFVCAIPVGLQIKPNVSETQLYLFPPTMCFNGPPLQPQFQALVGGRVMVG